jgi:hypothetical protein
MSTIIGSKAIKPNPALKLFNPLIGKWELTGLHPFLGDIVLHGQASFAWHEGGAFLLLRSSIDHPEVPDGIEIFGSDDKAGTFFMLHFDERGVSRKYDVTITEKQLKWWRNDTEFSQRFTMDIQKNSLTSYGEMQRGEGKEWEKDLSLTFKKQ